jgi:excisionase family DNA binding protein
MEVKEREVTIRYMTVPEIAAELRVTPQAVYQRVASGQLPATHIGRALRVKIDDYERFLEERTTPAKK